MVDLGAAWGDLTPEQLRETVEDVTYFLSEFGSTGAVRRKLHEQSSDIHYLGNSVRRFLGKPQEPEKLYSEEGYGFIINGIVGCDESLNDEVDRTMVDVKFFLEKFGATRTVRQRLETQRREIVGLHRTVRWLEDRERKRKREDIYGVGGLQNKAAAETQSVRSAQRMRVDIRNVGLLHFEQMSTLGSDTARCDAGGLGGDSTLAIDVGDAGATAIAEPSDVKRGGEHTQEGQCGRPYSELWDCVPPFFTILSKSAVDATNSHGDIDPRQLVKAQQNYNAGASETLEEKDDEGSHGILVDAPTSKLSKLTCHSKVKPFCSYPSCRNQVQVNGLCCRHGGYRMCKFDGCDRRAISRQLCREHGGGGIKCKFDGCDKAACFLGYCISHARDHNIENKITANCIEENCGKPRQKDGYCVDYDFEQQATNHDLPFEDGNHARNQRAENTDKTASTTSLTNKRYGHKTCKTADCNRRRMKNGDSPLYCFRHQGVLSSKRFSGDNACDQSPSNNETSKTTPSNLTGFHKKCKIDGCMKQSMRGGNQSMYCIGHQGWIGREAIASSPRPNVFKAPPRRSTVKVKGHKTCKIEGCMKWIRNDNLYCPDHQEEFSIETMDEITDDLYDNVQLCKAPGCKSTGKLGNFRPGYYCFRHGGGPPCKHPGCTKKRQGKGLCKAHGGWYKCKTQGCDRHASRRGFCLWHFRATTS